MTVELALRAKQWPASAIDADPLIPAVAPDGTLYPVGKLEAHRRGLLHLAISVFVFSGREMLIQRRAAGKYHCGLQWANSCCTHPYWRESLGDAAARRIGEELGFSCGLRAVGTLTYRADVGKGLFEYEKVLVYRGDAGQDRPAVDPDPDEVAETRWISVAAVRAEALTHPEDFTPWFRIYLARWSELGL